MKDTTSELHTFIAHLYNNYYNVFTFICYNNWASRSEPT